MRMVDINTATTCAATGTRGLTNDASSFISYVHNQVTKGRLMTKLPSAAVVLLAAISGIAFAADNSEAITLPDLKLRLTAGSGGRDLDIFRNKEGQTVATIGAPGPTTRCVLNNNPVKLERLGDDIVKVTFLPKENDDLNQLCTFFIEVNSKGVGMFKGGRFTGTVAPR